MLDIKFVRENPEIVKQNIRNKFQDMVSFHKYCWMVLVFYLSLD